MLNTVMFLIIQFVITTSYPVTANVKIIQAHYNFICFSLGCERGIGILRDRQLIGVLRMLTFEGRM
jgi:hypothetical protein